MVTGKTGADTIREVYAVFKVLSHLDSVFSAFVLLVFSLVGTVRHIGVRRHRLEFWRDTLIRTSERCGCFRSPYLQLTCRYFNP